MSLSNSYPDQVLKIVESLVLFCCLPKDNLVNPRNTKTTGVWMNTPAYSNWGICSKTPGNNIQASVSGRYIAFSTTIGATSMLSSYGSLNVTIDGVVVSSNIPQIMRLSTTLKNTAWCSNLWLYDTGVDSSHSIIIEIGTSVGGFSDYQYIDWIAGFSSNNSNTNSVILTAVETADPSGLVMLKTGQSGDAGVEVNRLVLNQGYKNIAKRFQSMNLPVYFVQESGSYTYAQLTGDLIHPNKFGHDTIFNRVANVIKNGEIV
jgi:hypothetical protein